MCTKKNMSEKPGLRYHWGYYPESLGHPKVGFITRLFPNSEIGDDLDDDQLI